MICFILRAVKFLEIYLKKKKLIKEKARETEGKMKGKDPDFMMNFQKQIKNNSVDLQNLVTDLADWSEETIQKEQTRKTTGGSRAAAGQAAATASRKPLPPIRNRIDI